MFIKGIKIDTRGVKKIMKAIDYVVDTFHARLNYQLTEKFNALDWNNDGWKDEVCKLISKVAKSVKRDIKWDTKVKIE